MLTCVGGAGEWGLYKKHITKHQHEGKYCFSVYFSLKRSSNMIVSSTPTLHKRKFKMVVILHLE